MSNNNNKQEKKEITGWGQKELNNYAYHNVMTSPNKRYYNNTMKAAINFETNEKISRKDANKAWEKHSWKRQYNRNYEFM